MKKKVIISMLVSTLIVTGLCTTSKKVYALDLNKDKIHNIIDGIHSGVSDILDDLNSNIGKDKDKNNENHTTKSLAKEIKLNTPEEFIAKKAISSNWSKFIVPDDGLVKIDIKIPLKGNGDECLTRIKLQNEDSIPQVYLDTTNSSVTLKDGQSYKEWVVGLKAGTYYLNITCGLKILDDSELTIPYKVDYIKTDNFEKEDNNSFDNANEINFDKQYYGIMNEDSHIKNNNDFYKFQLDDRGVCLSFTRYNVDNNYIVALVDYMGTPILPTKTEYKGKTTDYYFNGLEPGEFYLTVKGGLPTFTQGLYSFEIKNSRDGWIKENNKWYYYEKDQKKTGFITIDRNKYYLDKDGARQTGWINIYGKKYYADDNGVLRTGWNNIDGNHYYMDQDGVMAKDWLYISGLWYYFGNDGNMRTGWIFEGDSWYYLNDAGVMKTGWFDYNGAWYYLNDNGKMATGWKNINYNWYYMNENGSMATGWMNDGHNWYYLGSSGVMQKGWINQNNTWYYLKDNGSMAIGWNKINGAWYYMYSNGSMATGWIAYDGYWYYLYNSGAMATYTTIDSWSIDDNGIATPTN